MTGDVPQRALALLIIDNQRAFADRTHWGPIRSNPQYENNVSRLLAASRKASLLIIHVKHISLQLNSALHPSAPAPPDHPLGGMGTDFEDNSTPLAGEPIVEKNVNSAFIGTNLEAMLRERRVQTLYICGLSTDHCVSTTTRMAGNLHVCDVPNTDGRTQPGRIILVDDATACWQKPKSVGGGRWDAETVHAVHVESLREFATIASADSVIQTLGDRLL
jgi:nicotinamidase-related amidase